MFCKTLQWVQPQLKLSPADDHHLSSVTASFSLGCHSLIKRYHHMCDVSAFNGYRRPPIYISHILPLLFNCLISDLENRDVFSAIANQHNFQNIFNNIMICANRVWGSEPHWPRCVLNHPKPTLSSKQPLLLCL